MRTFERRKQNALWIWDIDLTGKHLTVLHGKRGQPMRVLHHDFDDTAHAEKEHQKSASQPTPEWMKP